MPGIGRCIIQSHGRHRTPDDKTSTVRTLGFGVCCVLSMYGNGDVAGDGARFNPIFNVDPNSTLATLQGNELISTYCGTRFNSIPCEDRFDWIRKVEARLRCLDFVSSALSEHPYELHACIIQVNATLVEANLHTKPIFTGAEVTAIQIVRDVLIQLNDAITRFCPESFPTRFWEGILNLKNRGPASSNTPSQNTDGAWHSRAQNLLVKALAAQRQVPEKAEMVWDQMAEVLSEAEEIIRTRCFSDVELKTLAHIFQVAVDFAPVWPCVAQCAKVWFEMRESANKVKKLHPNVDPVLPPQQLPVFLREDVILEKPQDVFQGSTPFNGLESHNSEQVARSDLSRPLSHPQSITLDSGQHQVQQQTTQHDPGAPHLDERLLLGKEPEARFPEPPELSAPQPSNDEPDVVERADELVPKEFSNLEKQASKIQLSASIPPSVDTSIQITRQLIQMNHTLSEVGQKLPALDEHSLAALTKVRSTLLSTRQKLRSKSRHYLSPSHMARTNEALASVSRLWHLARLAHSKNPTLFNPGELDSLIGVEGLLKQQSLPTFVASETYAALLSQDSEEAVNGLLIFLDLTNDPIDLPTAKLCLLNLLYLNNEKTELLKLGAQDTLIKLISRLHHEIVEAKETKFFITKLPEFNDFRLAYFGERPLSMYLKQYNDHFVQALEQKRRKGKATIAPHMDQLKSFRSSLLNVDLRGGVFTDEKTLAYFKQFSAFAEQCLNECQVDGCRTRHEHLPALKLTLDGLVWCRLLFINAGVTLPSALKEACDKIAKAWALKTLWSREETASLHNAERAFISKRILAVLESDKNDKLLTWSRAFLDRSVPLSFVETIMDDILLDRATSSVKHEPCDDDTMVLLLASGCRLCLFEADVAYKPKHSLSTLRKAVGRSFTTATVEAHLLATSSYTLPSPGRSSEALHPRLKDYFLAPPPRQAARVLSPSFVLEEALKEARSDDLSLSDVAHHVAAYLLGICTKEQHIDFVDQQWLDFLTCQLKWCTTKLKEYTGRELTFAVRSIDTSFRAFWHKHRRHPLGAQATPYFIRHFVNMTTLKWLSDKRTGNLKCHQADRQVMRKILGHHVLAWMPKWMAFMHRQKALFPSSVVKSTDRLFTKLCDDVARHVDYITKWVAEPSGVLEPSAVSDQLRDLLKRLGAGTITQQHVKALLKQHMLRVTSRGNRNMFLTFLLYAWHYGCLPVDMTVIEECIKITVKESLHHEKHRAGMSVNTMQECITKMLITWEGDVWSPEASNVVKEPTGSKDAFIVTEEVAQSLNGTSSS